MNNEYSFEEMRSIHKRTEKMVIIDYYNVTIRISNLTESEKEYIRDSIKRVCIGPGGE